MNAPDPLETDHPPAAPQLAREIIDSILESPDALEIMFGGSAATMGSDVPSATSDASAYEKQVFVQDNVLMQAPWPSEVFHQG